MCNYGGRLTYTDKKGTNHIPPLGRAEKTQLSLITLFSIVGFSSYMHILL